MRSIPPLKTHVCTHNARPPRAHGCTARGYRVFDHAPHYKELKLNSLYFELGENSFMKEVIAAQVGGGWRWA